MESKTVNQPGSSRNFNSSANFRNLYLFSGNTLLPLSPEYLDANSPTEKNFRSEKELEELVFNNGKTLFGQNTTLIPLPKDGRVIFEKDFSPNGFLIDAGDPARPRLYILDIMLAKQSFFGYVFPRITKFFSFFKSEENVAKLCELLAKEKEIKKALPGMGNTDLQAQLKNALTGKPAILIIMDNEMKEMPQVMEVYAEMWQRVKPILIQKYASNGNTFCMVSPPFASINHVNHKERKPREKVVYTEENHLEHTSDEMRGVYTRLKADLLKLDAGLTFNAQKYYISLHKNRNLAFFHFSRKKISLVVMAPEKDARKIIKHHDVKTLAESVQKFYNGSSCSIEIADAKHLNEVTGLLKKLITE